jgi:acetyl-CoA carboxylase biotin carboxyl carrier protein
MERTIKSPLPGTFYRAPTPGADPYVKEGETVRVGDIIGLVEVMKLFQEITSEVDGTVTRFLVENGGLVDAGQDIVKLAG